MLIYLRLLLLIATLCPIAYGQDAVPAADQKKKQPHIRFICISALSENQELVLAARDEEGEWQEFGPVTLRSSFITEWFPAKTGELHLTMREGETLKSLGQFNFPSDCRRAIAVIIPNEEKKNYNALIVDPEKIDLAKGSVLAINFSKQPGIVLLGTNKVTLASGQRIVAKPTLEENGMYRLMVAHQDAEGKAIPCYDRYLPGNPDARDLLFLLPDPTNGLKVFNLPMFGEFD
jgi:hypothetical protein